MTDSGKPFKFFPFIISMSITLSIAAITGFFSESQIKGWYLGLHKPTFNPPNAIFAPVWTFLYIMIAFAAYLAWYHRRKRIDYVKARFIYFVQLILNASWSVVFFNFHQILAGFIVILALIVSIVLNIKAFGKINNAAAWFLIPYLLWVIFAGVLNFSFYWLNR